MLKIALMHQFNEVGASAQRRIWAAGKMYDLAMRYEAKSEARRSSLHKALDVVLCEGKIKSLDHGTADHRRFWEIGHKITTALMDYKEELNVAPAWKQDHYPEDDENL
ncbi:MAG: hypothetical protein AAGI46_12925 [Planctomycetota bacterium]